MLAGFLITVGGICYFAQPLVENSINQVLPIPVWLPFEINVLSYWILYTYEAAVFIFLSTFAICQDVLMFGLMLQICKQLDILVLRISNIIKFNDDNQESQLSGCIVHHIQVFRSEYIFNYYLLACVY